MEKAVQAEWKSKWEKGMTDWHRSVVDTRLRQHLKELTRGEPNVSILVTWCGKSQDLLWLCSEGYNVVGIELSELGVKQLFQENSVPYSVKNEGEFAVYQAMNRKLKVIAGDFYKVTPELAGTFEAIWDINAFGAAEPADRQKHISALLSLLKSNGRILLCNWEYGDKVRDKAPYSLSSSLVKELFQEKFDVEFLGKRDMYTEYIIEIYNVDWAYEVLHLLSSRILSV